MLEFDAKKQVVTIGLETFSLPRRLAQVMDVLYNANGETCTIDRIGEYVYGLAWYDSDINPGTIERRIWPGFTRSDCKIRETETEL